jgi:uncharacterized protein (TIGR03435 family)
MVRLVGFPFGALTFVQIEGVADDPERVTKGELQQMLQTLLEDRFKARVHTELREVDGYVLTIAKSGIKFKETSGETNIVSADPTVLVPAAGLQQPGKPDTDPVPGEPLLHGRYTMEGVVKFLGNVGFAPVADKTGLTSVYDINFELEEILSAVESQGRGGPQNQPPPQFTTPVPKALEDELGLHLERGKVAVEFIVVDHLEMPAEN